MRLQLSSPVSLLELYLCIAMRRGPGVVGEQPVLAPGQSFEYSSGCPLRTPVGSMEGHYEMIVLDDGTGHQGQPFQAAIGKFGLNMNDKC